VFVIVLQFPSSVEQPACFQKKTQKHAHLNENIFGVGDWMVLTIIFPSVANYNDLSFVLELNGTAIRIGIRCRYHKIFATKQVEIFQMISMSL
jgi:hypothetical protein